MNFSRQQVSPQASVDSGRAVSLVIQVEASRATLTTNIGDSGAESVDKQEPAADIQEFRTVSLRLRDMVLDFSEKLDAFRDERDKIHQEIDDLKKTVAELVERSGEEGCER